MKRSKAAVIRKKQKTTDILMAKSAVLAIVDKVQAAMYDTHLIISAAYALDIVAKEVKEWQP